MKNKNHHLLLIITFLSNYMVLSSNAMERPSNLIKKKDNYRQQFLAVRSGDGKIIQVPLKSLGAILTALSEETPLQLEVHSKELVKLITFYHFESLPPFIIFLSL